MLYGWMKSIIIYLILSGIVVNMSPSGNYKKYIQFFTGLLLIIIIAEPVKFIFNISSLDLEKLVQDINYGITYKEEGEEEKSENYYDFTMEESIKNLLRQHDLEADRIVIISSQDYIIKKCVVNYYPEAGNNSLLSDKDFKEIKKTISDVYNIETDNIYIVSR